MEREEESDDSEAVIEHIELPKGHPGDSVHKFFKSQRDVAIGAATPVHDSTSNKTGFQKMAKAIMQQNMTRDLLLLVNFQSCKYLHLMVILYITGFGKMLFQTWVDSKTLDFGVGHTKTAEDIPESKSLFDQLPVGFNVSLIQSTDIILNNDLPDNHVVGRYRMCKTDLQTLTDSSWFNDLFIDCLLPVFGEAYLSQRTQQCSNYGSMLGR